MAQPEVLPETDLAVVHALQVAPRASWQRIGAAVGVDPGTAARRWARLEEQRLAWLTIWPAPASLAEQFDAAVVRLRCDPSQVRAAAYAAGELPWTATVDLTVGSYDVVVLVVGPGLPVLRDRVDEVAALPGVREHTSTTLAAVHADDTRWQMRVLSAHQLQQLTRSGKAPPESPRPPRPEVLAALVAGLGEDVRRPLQPLAEQLGWSEATARRALDRAVASGALHLGCDLSSAVTGEGRMVLLEAELDTRDRDLPRLSRHPAVRRCYETVGRGTAHLAVRLRSLAQLAALEAALAEHVAGWTVHDRLTVTGSVKRNGYLLASDGRVLRRATAFV